MKTQKPTSKETIETPETLREPEPDNGCGSIVSGGPRADMAYGPMPTFPEMPDSDTLRSLLEHVWKLCEARHRQILKETYQRWERERHRFIDEVDRLYKSMEENHAETERQTKIATALDSRLRLWEMDTKDRNLRRKLKRLRTVKL